MKYGLFLACGLVFSVKNHLGWNINLNDMGKLHGALKLREYNCEKEVYFSISLLIMKIKIYFKRIYLSVKLMSLFQTLNWMLIVIK